MLHYSINSKESFGVSLIFLIQKVKLSCCSIFNELWLFCFLLIHPLDSLLFISSVSLSQLLYYITFACLCQEVFESFLSFFRGFFEALFCTSSVEQHPCFPHFCFSLPCFLVRSFLFSNRLSQTAPLLYHTPSLFVNTFS